jgi:hypothetical protein
MARLRSISLPLLIFTLLVLGGLGTAQTSRQIQGIVTTVNCQDLYIQIRTDNGQVWTVVFDDAQACSKVRNGVKVTVKGRFDSKRRLTLTAAEVVLIQTTDTPVGIGEKTVTGTITELDPIDRFIRVRDDAGTIWRLEFDKPEDLGRSAPQARVSVLGQTVPAEPNKLLHSRIQGFISSDKPDPAGPGYIAMGKARHRHDFNVDGKDDIITFYQPINSAPEYGAADVCVAVSDGTAFKLCEYVSAQNFSFQTQIPAVGDFDGDGRADILNFTRGDDETKKTYAFRRNEVNMAPNRVMFAGPEGIWHDVNFNGNGACYRNEIPLMGDFNGDRRTDIAVVVPGIAGARKAGEVYVLISTGTAFYAASRWATGFCSGDEWPIVGDFDGDGKDDLAVFIRSSASGDREGNVAVSLSTGSGFKTKTRWHDRFCVLGEIPLAGDFNGDGKDDIITFCRNEYPNQPGNVYVALSDGRSFGSGELWSDFFCVGNEIPMTGDFDGDGRTDIASFTHGTKPESPGEVWVSLSDRGKKFSPGRIWMKNFCLGDEIPQIYAALFPYHMFKYSMESDDVGFAVYFSDEENEFADNAHDFKVVLNNVIPQEDYLVGARSYLQWDHMAHAEKSDLVYAMGHGCPSTIWINSDEILDMNLTPLGSWSSHNRMGDLDWIALHSCSVTSMEDVNGLTWSERWESRPWRRGPFAGLHAVLGFKLVKTILFGRETCLSIYFAGYLAAGLPVIDCWMEAADDEDLELLYNNKPACFYHDLYRVDNLLNSHRKEDIWYNHPGYGLYVIRER